MRKIMPFILCMVMLFCMPMYADVLTVKEINGKKYYEYEVQKGEGLWGISRRFSVTQDELNDINPSLANGLKAGSTILIPVNENNAELFQSASESKESDTWLKHEVKRKETLYSISRMYDVQIHDIISANPEVENGLKSGMIIRIPSKKKENAEVVTSNKNVETKEIQHKEQEKAEVEKVEPTKATMSHNGVKHEVKKKETLYSISKRYGVSINQILENNPEAQNGLKAGMILSIPVESDDIANTLVKSALTIENKPMEVEEKKEDVSNVNNPVVGWKSPYTHVKTDFKREAHINVAFLLPFMTGSPVVEEGTGRFIEFYKGALLAMEHAKRRGISMSVFTYDIKRGTAIIDSVLKLPEMDSIDVIIGPAYTDQVNTVVRYAKKKDIVCVVPFSSNIPDLLRYDKLIQFNPSQEQLFDRVIRETFAPRSLHYVVADVNATKNKGSHFADALKLRLKKEGVPCPTVKITPENVDTLLTFAGGDTLLVMLNSSAAEDVVEVLDSIKAMNDRKILIWGFEEWNAFITTCPNTYYYSLFNPKPGAEYVSEYTRWFGTRESDAAWQYDLIGYDIVTFVVNAVEKDSKGKANLVIEYAPTDIYLQSDMNFEKQSRGGYVNTNYHLFFYDGEKVNDIERF